MKWLQLDNYKIRNELFIDRPTHI